MSEFSPAWLALREPADADARAVEPLDALREHLDGTTRPVIRDLGAGSGSMGRWLAPRLGGPQHWVMYDRDPALLTLAAAGMAPYPMVTVETRQGDVAGLTAADLAGASLVTASALLDLLTAEEVDGLAEACAGAGCAALFTLSVAGRVRLSPADPLDGEVEAAFNNHQRRVHSTRRLLGPDAPGVAAEAFTRRGATVLESPSPWRLGPERAALTAEWLRGWVGAAVEQQSELAEPAKAYLSRRLDAVAAGTLRAEVDHRDLLALPG
ncbi:class I SAM-dependent methyltransferase [Phytohabitans sp. ZYX-F-186]|uniref:Class I SAM-dependent methyltransferase n=1 Tax=Phytohabitans maris TaxID=3071409 RepID=A0ABU0ZCC1_9ACTN|nr:class I SAM-dependent methyltransferase [Phytohabitans sp. ZYX-F-186]MDQ7903977.1 class I SAM-dependent methyltransferase [Phytohabitans sp. ZYX-F-186]